MVIDTRYIQVHTDAIVEWIWDDQLYFADDYSVINDISNNTRSFTFSSTAQPTTYNKLPNQLYLIDETINKFGIVDPANKQFLQETKYINNQPTKFNKVKIWFPISYNFNNNVGFYLRTYTYNFDNAVKYYLSNFYIDLTVQSDFNKIINESSPFRLNGRLWGKSIEILIPEVYSEALNRSNNAPIPGTINYRLTNGEAGLSQTSPIYIDFRFLTKKSTVLGESTFLASPPIVTSIPQTPEYNNLAVKIEHASDGDYFLINGTYNGSTGKFETFMQSLTDSGMRSYILYTITVYEENLPQDPRDIYVYQDYYKGINDYRPVFKHSNTTASIRVDMKLINTVDSSVITKSSEYVLIGNEVSKYGKHITPINISGAIKPKLYNTQPDQSMLPPKELLNSHLRRKIPLQPEIRFVTFPVLTNVFNVVAQDVTVQTNNTKYYGNNKLSITLNPFDNVFKITVFKINNDTVVPFEIPSINSIVQFVLKSDTTELRLPLYLESNEVNLKHGTVVFKLPASDMGKVKKILQKNNKFYLTLTTNGVETTLYNGVLKLNDTTTQEETSQTTTETLVPKEKRSPVLQFKPIQPIDKNTFKKS
jgi:hypothetical protein